MDAGSEEPSLGKFSRPEPRRKEPRGGGSKQHCQLSISIVNYLTPISPAGPVAEIWKWLCFCHLCYVGPPPLNDQDRAHHFSIPTRMLLKPPASPTSVKPSLSTQFKASLPALGLEILHMPHFSTYSSLLQPLAQQKQVKHRTCLPDWSYHKEPCEVAWVTPHVLLSSFETRGGGR